MIKTNPSPMIISSDTHISARHCGNAAKKKEMN